MIEVRGVSKTFTIPHQSRRTLYHRLRGVVTYESFAALTDASLGVRQGEFVGLLGRNGSGKSTLLRIVAGIYRPTAGDVRVAGDVAPILDLGAGFHGALAVRDNVFLYGVLLGIPRRRLADELAQILDAAGVARFADARLDTLSTGLRMRLAFTVAMRSAAPILLIDEALSVGDESFQRRCVDELQAARTQGRTALVVSHDPYLLETLCDRIIVLDGGIVRGDGPPRDMIDLYHAL